MKTRSIGFRLTLWYAAIVLTSLVVFGVSVWVSVRRNVEHAVDDELRERMSGVSRFLTGLLTSGDREDVGREFEEHSSFTSHGELLQVVDTNGNFIYRSDGLHDAGIPPQLPERLAGAGKFATLNLGSVRFRLLWSPVSVEGRAYAVGIARPMTEFDEVFERLAWIVLWLIPLVLILATAGGYWMSRRALAPVDEITRAARSIGIQNLAYRLAVPHTGDELQRLSETLNDMMQRLDTAVKRITQFTADASHELRTPIALMRTTAEVALRRDRSAEEYREALSQVLAELERTSGLVENLMLLARADSGAEALLKHPADLAQSVREACSQGQTLAAARGIRFDFALAGGRVPVEGDAQALRRLFLILIDNAIKYTAAGGRVSVSLASTDGIAVGEVRDSGIGISPADLPNIFERFYRADKARSPEMGGAGLGLSIARWIVENHEGEIHVQSQLGKGSTFRVQLPLKN